MYSFNNSSNPFNVNIYVTNILLSSQTVNVNNFNIWHNAVIMLGSEVGHTVGFIMNQPVMNINQEQISKIYGIENQLPRQSVYCGGPVSMEKITIMHTLDYNIQGTNQINDHCAITFNEQIAQDILSGNGPDHYKIMVGYCVWADGQLDAEIGRKMWLEDEYDPIVWAKYKRKSKMWRKIIEKNASKATNQFLNSLA
jgi:putative AlgH/UPF0301 family transcriptional regulator